MKAKKIVFCLALFYLGIGTGKAQYTNLINFTDTSASNIGATPYGDLTLSSGGVLYGMTESGGTDNDGNIFSYNLNTNTFTDLVDFTGTSGSYIGEYPQGSLTLSSGGVSYGMTESGGTNGYGNIFSYNLNTNTFTDLVDFTGISGSYIGATPYGSLTLSSGVLYGMTEFGGTDNDGNIFSYNLNTNTFTDLIDFSGTSGSYMGDYPYGSLTLSSSGVLYGMTHGGGTDNDGNIFSYNLNTNIFTDLVDFTGTSGSYPGLEPFGSLTLSSGGVLYGMTLTGGTNGYGNIFSYALLTAITSVVNNVSCNAGTNGSASVTVSIGSPPYTYSWSPVGGIDSTASGLSAGTYTVTVTDSTGLTNSAAVIITQPPVLNVSAFVVSNVSCGGSRNGIDSVSVFGGHLHILICGMMLIIKLPLQPPG
jgi:uncharacterized repeat protein (TIGR03803 family)